MNKSICSIVVLAIFLGSATLTAAENSLIIYAYEDQAKETISKHIYGHFSEHLGRCIYDGFWVGGDSPIPNTNGIRNDIVEALKKSKIPVLRWPGGCFADTYHWKDGIGPRENRPTIVNTHWGGVTENNHFGTHEFMDLCEQLECEPYICGNVGSGTVQEMQEWIEYITFDGESPMADLRRKNGQEKAWKLKYFGVGNENWGCGGHMTAEYYADLYNHFQTYVGNYSGNRVYKVAGGPGCTFDPSYEWTEVLMSKCRRYMNGLSLHHYVSDGDWSNKYTATDFDESRWFSLLKGAVDMDELIARHSNIMDTYDPEKRIGLIVDEWGTWHAVEPGTNPGFLYQQNTLRDAIFAGIALNIFNQHCDRVKMANIAQTVNVLQAMVLTDGPKLILTPTYHVFEMFNVHQESKLLPTDLQCSKYSFGDDSIQSLHVSASRDDAGRIHISICNLDSHNPAELKGELRGDKAGRISGRVLTANSMKAHNTFDNPEAVKPVAFKAVKLRNNMITATLPPMSVVILEIE